MKRFSHAVLIGRYQPFHAGHDALFRHALSIADRIIIILGSYRAPRSLRNPWTSSERETLIRAALEDVPAEAYEIVPIHDSAYNFNDWLIRVQRAVAARAGDGNVALVGHYKDDSSYYLDCFPHWHVEIREAFAGGISSTDVRDAYFRGRLDDVRAFLPAGVFARLQEWTTVPAYRDLAEEYDFIQNYRKQWENAPYPPTFVTTDAVVFALGHVLLIRRAFNPGRGRLALPGGFVGVHETIEHACLRELHEETALDVSRGRLLGSMRMNHVFDHPQRDPRGRMITHAYMFELGVKDLPAVKAGDDAREALWFPLHELEDAEESFFSDHAQIIRFFMNRMR